MAFRVPLQKLTISRFADKTGEKVNDSHYRLHMADFNQIFAERGKIRQ